MRKVSIGFKGDPELNLEIMEEAQEAEMTRSAYLESIVENRHVKEDVRMLRSQIRQAKQENSFILNKLEQYEERLEPIFDKYAGKELPFRRRDGSMEKKLITTPFDLLDCILSSLKKEP